jgi:hypothetical protein
MSAPQQGRQSPEPETQTGAQQKDAPSSVSGTLSSGGEQLEGKAKDAQENVRGGLESNPTHPLEKFAEEKTSKK